MITIKDGDLFSVTEGVICHQVNCQGVMGSGVAKYFKQRFPTSYKYYLDECNSVTDKSLLLGRTLNCYEDSESIITISMFAQEKYGYNGQCFTDYNAFRKCCKTIAYDLKTYHKTDMTINMPYKIGCGRGGGNWDTILRILWEEFGDYNVVLWRLNTND